MDMPPGSEKFILLIVIGIPVLAILGIGFLLGWLL
jgi:hypothetical protein